MHRKYKYFFYYLQPSLSWLWFIFCPLIFHHILQSTQLFSLPFLASLNSLPLFSTTFNVIFSPTNRSIYSAHRKLFFYDKRNDDGRKLSYSTINRIFHPFIHPWTEACFSFFHHFKWRQKSDFRISLKILFCFSSRSLSSVQILFFDSHFNPLNAMLFIIIIYCFRFRLNKLLLCGEMVKVHSY